MKNWILILAPLLAVFFISLSPKVTDNDGYRALSSSKITFFGINYQKLAILHEDGFTDKNKNTKCKPLLHKYFKEWNEKFIIEDYKFDVPSFFNVSEVETNLEQSNTLNLDWKNYDNCIFNTSTYKLSRQDRASIVRKYDASKHEIGVVIIAESLSKELDRGKYYFVYFDTASSEILYEAFYEAPPGGIGFSSYWINSLYECLKQHQKKIKKDLKQLSK